MYFLSVGGYGAMYDALVYSIFIVSGTSHSTVTLCRFSNQKLTWNTSVQTTAFSPPCNNADHKQMLQWYLNSNPDISSKHQANNQSGVLSARERCLGFQLRIWRWGPVSILMCFLCIVHHKIQLTSGSKERLISLSTFDFVPYCT